MRLLFDAMLSPSLTSAVRELFPESLHVLEVGLQSSDSAIWDFAKANGFAIVTKDNDFQGRAEVFGSPPKVILIRIGNCRSRVIESLLRMSLSDIQAFQADLELYLLVLPPNPLVAPSKNP